MICQIGASTMPVWHAPTGFKMKKHLTFSMLYMQDGNNSLKWIWRRLVDADRTPGASCEHIDMRIIGGDLYLS